MYLLYIRSYLYNHIEMILKNCNFKKGIGIESEKSMQTS